MSAEARFIDAFIRLRDGKTIILPLGSLVTQNNVAREAGCDPSALRKSRFPKLIREIQAYLEIENSKLNSERASIAKKKRDVADLKGKIQSLRQERDHAQSQLLSAQHFALELLEENASLRLRLDALKPPHIHRSS